MAFSPCYPYVYQRYVIDKAITAREVTAYVPLFITQAESEQILNADT